MSTCDPRDTFTINTQQAEDRANSITINTGGSEMLRVAADGFYIRGVRVPADDKEAAAVYAAFKEFLVWSQLTR